MNTDYFTKDYMPGARWSIGGGLLHGTTMLQLCEGITKELAGILRLDTLHATPACAWSVDWSTQRPLTTPTTYMQLLRKAAELKQPVCLSFDNPYVAKNLVEDDFGLFLVNELVQNNPTNRNAVVVADDRVAMVLRRNFPKLPLIAHMNRSVCEENEPDAAFYNHLLGFYNAVQLYPTSTRIPQLLQNLEHPERCIIVTNDCCRQGSRNAHRDMLLLLAQMRIRPYAFAFKVRRSEQMPALMSVPGSPGNALSRKQIQELYAAGFRQFHVQAEQYRNGMTPAWVLMNLITPAAAEHSNMRALVSYKAFCYLNGAQSPIASGLEPFTLRYPE
jgi:hypothetical protein